MDDIDIEVSTMKVLKSGEIREKFEIKVDNKNGASSYKGNSGGEKQKINLSISLAFNMLMRKMTGNPINVLFLDEPFEALDSGSAEAAISLCKMIS
jgi:DNA repair exonuclease SbcCD ATPase subunit